MTPVVIYARYSSHAQTELSIEGQLRDCYAFCEQHDFQVVGEYIDRAISGRTDERPDFQRMIFDAQKQAFRFVVVWKLDRFARSRYDSAFYKAKLKKYGVKVMSVTENITDDPEGIILEGMLESLAEYYSANLSKHVKRGLRESVLQKNVIGSAPYGYRVKDRKLILNDHTAPIVQFIFNQYDSGVGSKAIANTLNARGERTITGRPFTVNTINQILTRERYTGIYVHEDTIVEDYCPVIIEKDLFDRVQTRLAANKRAPAAAKAEEPYLLQGKLYCGHCGAAMVGESGRGKQGYTYKYYSCRSRKKHHTCDKRNERKETVEAAVVDQTIKYILSEKKLHQIATRVMKEFETDTTAQEIEVLRRRRAALDESVANVVDTLAVCPERSRQQLVAKLDQLTGQQQEVDERIDQLRHVIPIQMNEAALIAWIKQFCDGDPEDPDFREHIIDTFIGRVYIYDNSMLIFYNIGDKCVTSTTSADNCSDSVNSEGFGFDCARLTFSGQIRTPRLVSVRRDGFAILFPK